MHSSFSSATLVHVEMYVLSGQVRTKKWQAENKSPLAKEIDLKKRYFFCSEKRIPSYRMFSLRYAVGVFPVVARNREIK